MRRTAPATTLVLALLVAGACSGADDDRRASVDVDSSRAADVEAGAGAEGEGDAASAGPFVRTIDLRALEDTEGTADFEVTAIERTADSTALYYTVTSQEDVPVEEGDSDRDNWPVLVEPVSGQVFAPLFDGDDDLYGSHDDGEDVPLLPGVRNELRIYFPALPEDVDTVSLHVYGTGVMTGLPVTPVDAHRPSPELDTDHDGDGTPPPGSTITFPVREPDAEAQELDATMLSYVDSPAASTERSGDAETIALRAEVLFDFDEATLRPDAAAILEDTAGSIRANAAEGEESIEVVGHADGVGDPAYNQALSEDRAQAVADELGSLLDGYSFEVSGRGSAEPVVPEGGPDDEAARARNRRVELRYTVELADDATEDASGDAGPAGVDVAERHVAEPHPFRADDDGPEVSATIDGWRLDAFPLVRDGAYLVGTFEITNTGGVPARPELVPPDVVLPDRYNETSLGGFRLRESGTDVTRFVALIDDGGEYGVAADRVGELPPGRSVRVVALYPAPPVDHDEITLLAGPFGDLGPLPIV